MDSSIPIGNIYYLLCYAWDRLSERQFANVSTAGATSLADLFARVLLSGLSRLRRKGLERGYEVRCEEIPGIRGRVDIFGTKAKFLDRHGRACCHFDELTIDTPQNRVVKAAVLRLALVQTLDKDNRHELRKLARSMTEVSTLPLNSELFKKVRLHTNNRHYKFLIHVAQLIMSSVVVDERRGGYLFRDFTRDRHEMASLFQRFIFRFLKIERPDLRVSSDQLRWNATSEDDPDLSHLPSMFTDVSLRAAGQTTVIEAKFYEETFSKRYDREKVHSGHLFQLVSYLRNLRITATSGATPDGVLIYPVTSDAVDLRYKIEGYNVRVYTLNLGNEWQSIERELRHLVSGKRRSF